MKRTKEEWRKLHDKRKEDLAALLNIEISSGLNDFIIKNGDRIAQMILAPVIKMELEECHDLPETVRGIGGFGSTGK